MHDFLETTFDAWWRRQAGGAGLRVGLSPWTKAGSVLASGGGPPTASLSLRKSHVFADRYVPGVLEETRLIIPMRLGMEGLAPGRAVWREPDGDRPMSAEDLATLVVLAVRQGFHIPPRKETFDPGFAALTHWALTALDADDGTLVAAIKRIEPRAFWWWGAVLHDAGEPVAAERAWMWQVQGPDAAGPPDAAIRSLIKLMDAAASTPADRLGLCRRAQRIFDETGFRDFDLQTALDLARSRALIDLGYDTQGLEAIDEVDRRLIANPCAGALRQTARVAWLSWRAGGVPRALRATAALSAGVLRSGTARFKLRKAWAIRRLRSRHPRLPQDVTIFNAPKQPRLHTRGLTAPGAAKNPPSNSDDPHNAHPAPPEPVRPRLLDVRRVALVRLDRLGDLVLMQPVIAKVRARFPDAQIDLFVSAGLETFAEQWLVGVRGVGVNWKDGEAFKALRERVADAEPYDLLVDLLEPDTARHARLTRATPATCKVGFDSPARRETFTHRVPTPSRPMHLIERTAWLLRPLGLAIPDEVDWRPRLTPPPEAIEQGRALLREAWGPGRVVGIHVGAGWRFKRWYPASFAAVGRSLVERFGVKIAVLGGPSESDIAEAVAAQIGPAAQVFSPPLDQLPGVCAACDLMLVNDSGPMHVAVALGVPTVAAWGPGDRTLFAPRGDPSRVAVVADQPRCANCPQEVDAQRCPMGYRYDAVPCLRAVTVEAVLAACVGMIEAHLT